MWSFLKPHSKHRFSGDFHVLLRSRFQPVTKAHIEVVRWFFQNQFKPLSQKLDAPPTLTLAIVCDLLTGTDLGIKMDQLSMHDDEKALRIRRFKSRFRPEFNPLKPMEIVVDLMTAIRKADPGWLKHITVTLIPEFGCTIYASGRTAEGLSSGEKALVELFLPPKEQRKWLIPRFDQEDDDDILWARSRDEDVTTVTLDSQLSWVDAMARDHCEGVGLYGLCTYLMLHGSEQIERLLPDEVARRWKQLHLRDNVNARMKAELSRKSGRPDECLNEILTQENFRRSKAEHPAGSKPSYEWLFKELAEKP